VTYALATQLVVSIPGPLSDDGARELAAIWAELQAFGEQIEGLPLAELRDRLTEFEQRILTVVREEPATQGTDQPDGTAPTGSDAPGGGVAETTGSQGPDGDDAATPTGTRGPSTTAPTGSTAGPTSGAGAEPTGSGSGTSAPATTSSPPSGSTGSATASSTTG
jgi:putative peptide zinc metalloprotease protein